MVPLASPSFQLPSGGIEALARSLALELKPIRVNVISPGFVDTPLFDALGQEVRTAILAEAAQALPGGRVGRPVEIAEAIILLLSNGYMNAEVLHIDGGGVLPVLSQNREVNPIETIFPSHRAVSWG